jgi:hypothetical protein
VAGISSIAEGISLSCDFCSRLPQPAPVQERHEAQRDRTNLRAVPAGVMTANGIMLCTLGLS